MNETQSLAPRDSGGNALEKTLRGWLKYAQGAFPDAVADEKRLARAAERLKVAIVAAVEPQKLAACSPQSIGKCIALSAITELYPGPGEMKPPVWLIPRKGELCWQMGARGYQDLALRAGYRLIAFLVYEGEHFRLFQGTDPRVEHEVDLANEPTWERMRGGYVIAVDPGGKTEVRWLTKAEIMKRRRVAQTDNVWKSWPLEMALKTLYSYAGQRGMFPLDEVSRRAIAADNEAETGGLVLPGEAPRQVSASMAAITGQAPEDLPQAEPVPAEDESQEPQAAPEDESQEEPSVGFRLEVAAKEAGISSGKLTAALRAADLIGSSETWAQIPEDTPWEDVSAVLDELAKAKKR